MFREFVFFYRKILIITIINYFTINIETKALLILTILLVSMWMQSLDSPFISDDLNSLDFKATFVAFVTMFGGLLAVAADSEFTEIFMTVIIFLANISFLYHWIRRMFILHLPICLESKYLKCVHKCLEKLLHGLNIFFLVLKFK